MKFLIVVLLLCFALLTGCETVLYNKEMNMSKLEEKVGKIENTFKLVPADDPNQKGQPWIFEGKEITNWMYRQMVVSGSRPEFSPWIDNKYFVLDYENAIESIKLFSKYIWKYKYKGQSRDCDDYAFAYKTWLQFLLADTYEVEAAAPVAILFVEQKHNFANVPGGDYTHAVVGIGTDKGPVIMEPQNGRHILLKDYPNKGYIYYVIR